MFKSVNEGDNLKNVLVQRLKSNIKNLRRQTPLVMCGNEMIERDTGVIICDVLEGVKKYRRSGVKKY